MTAPKVSARLVEWAGIAGYGFTPESDSGAAMFWSNPGGETRYYVRLAPDDGFTLTSANRASAEQFELSTASMMAMEQYLAGLFGYDFRSMRRLPRIKTACKLEDIADVFHIGEIDSNGFRILFGPSGEFAASAHGRVNSIATLVELSHFLRASESELRASYEHPEGQPLFRV